MHRLYHASRTAADAYPALSERIVVNGVFAVCDPLGGLHLPDHDVLVVSDLHLEKGSAFARRGMMLPPYDTLSTLKILQAIIARHDPKIVISLGDNFHDRVGSALMPEMFRQMIVDMARGREWIWINGNHDPDGAATLPGTSLDELRLVGLTFRHEPGRHEPGRHEPGRHEPGRHEPGRHEPGRHEPGTNPVSGEIAGHLHPAAIVRRREKSVRRACFATDGTRLVMPAFGVTTGGMDLAHPTICGLFDQTRLMAHMLGRDRIYSVRFDNLKG